MINVVANIFYAFLLTNIVLCDNDCAPYNQLVRNNLKGIANDYLLSINASITEDKHAGFYRESEAQFFEKNFGAKSSSSQFVKISLILSYCDVPVQGTDENMLRQSMHEDIRKKDFEIGAEKLGTLLLLRSKLFMAPDVGVKDRCLTTENRNSFLFTMVEEFEILHEEVGSTIFDNFFGLFNSSDENNDFVDDNYFNVFCSDSKVSGQRKKRDTEEKIFSNKDYVVIRKQEFVDQDNMSMTFNVDSTIRKVVIQASKKCGGLQLFSTNETHGKPLKWSENKLELSIPVHERFGEWKLVSLNPVRKGCKVKVVGQSTMGFFHTSIAPRNIGGSFKVMHSKPTLNTEMDALLDFYGLVRSNTIYKAQTVRFLNVYGDDITDPINLDIPVGDEGTVTLKIPQITSSFRLMVEGISNKGAKFMRMDPRLIEISNLKIEYDSDLLIAKPGKKIRVPVNVTNYGETDIIKLDSWDEVDYAKVEPSQKRILTNQTKKFYLILNAPEEAEIGLTSKTVVIGRRRRSVSASQVSSSTTVITQKLKDPKMKSIHVTAKINSRFAETTMKTTVVNIDDKPREAVVDFLVPVDAFVTKFTVEVGGKIIEGKVEEKEVAEKLFHTAKRPKLYKRKRAIGKIASRDKSERDFRQSIVAAAGETVVFTVVYQALLYRFDSAYDYKVILNPNQETDNLVVDVFIVEETPLKYVKVSGSLDGDYLSLDRNSSPDEFPKSSKVLFSNDRRQCHVKYEYKFDKDKWIYAVEQFNSVFSVLYDVEVTDMYGSMSVNNGYFTHFFAARTYPTRPKTVVYVLDKSMSMWSWAEDQLHSSVNELIDQHDENDFFNIILFFSETVLWKEDLVFATAENKADAKYFLRRHFNRMRDGTDIKLAYSTAFDLLDPYITESYYYSNLTDIQIANYRVEFEKLHSRGETRNIGEQCGWNVDGPKFLRVDFDPVLESTPELLDVHVKNDPSITAPYRYATAVSGLDETGFMVQISRIDRHDISEGWCSEPTLHFWIKQETNSSFESFLETKREIRRKIGDLNKKKIEKVSENAAMICFLTDGRHIADETSNDEIARLVRERNNGRVQIHNVAYANEGNPDNYDLMQRISAESGGVARRVMYNLDGAAAISDFFFEVTNVVMTDVNVEYDNSTVSMLSKVNFPYISKGKEIVVSGKLNNPSADIDQESGAMDPKYNIKGELTGKGYKDKITVDFETNPFKTSRISESKYKIEQYSERIWAYMRIKKLLVDLKAMAVDSAKRNQTAAEALKLSLKYNFVTPLTSIIIIKEDVREKVEKYLTEEKARLANLPPTTAGPTTTSTTSPPDDDDDLDFYDYEGPPGAKCRGFYNNCDNYDDYGYYYGMRGPSTPKPVHPVTTPKPDHPKTVTYTFAPTDGYPYWGGYYRDPHVVLPLKSGLNLCFDWDGEDGEMTNLIYHEDSGLIVNAKMTAAPPGIESMNGKDRFYMYSIAFVIPQSKANIIVTPYLITIENFGMDSFSYPVSSKFSFSRSGLDIEVYDVIAKRSKSKVHLKIGDIQFKLMLHINQRVPHIDMAYEDLSHIEGEFKGLIGQFYGKEIALEEEDNGQKAVMRIGKELAIVKRHEMKSNPLTNQEQPCWFASNKRFSSIKHSSFVVESMTTKPHYTENVKTTTKVEKEIEKEIESGKAKLTVLEALFKSVTNNK